ncbi:MAG: hypothetical protein ACTIJ9_16360 [Aequorivita sp.]
MKEFLINLRPPKYLRYLFYISYSFYRNYKSERTDAHITATIFLAMFHMMALLGLLLFNFPKNLLKLGKYEVVLPVCLLIGIIFYLFFLYKKKWRKYIIEFNDQEKKDRIKGGIYLFIYLF